MEIPLNHQRLAFKIYFTFIRDISFHFDYYCSFAFQFFTLQIKEN